MTCQGKALEYLGMKIDYRQQGKVKFIMYEYIKKLLEEMQGLATTPTSSYLFNTDPGCKKLSEELGQLFHHLVAKLLYPTVMCCFLGWSYLRLNKGCSWYILKTMLNRHIFKSLNLVHKHV